MSDTESHEHATPIKTPTQLIVVVVLAFVVPVTLLIMLAQLVAGHSTKQVDPDKHEELVAQRLKPVGEVLVTDPNAPRVEKTGKQVVDQVCAACHATGALNAPKTGDKAAWAALIKRGQDNLTASAIKGIKQMPARGGNPDLSDTEMSRAVAYLANQAGATWKEPEAPAPKPAAAKTAPPEAAAATPAKGGDSAAKGKSVYDKSCAACHAAGAAGAPKPGDKAAWAPRLKGGMEALYASAIKGKNGMPPKGGNASLSDADVKAAVDYLAGLAK